MIILFYITFAALVGVMGSHRKIGFWGAFLLSLFLSPLIGFFITLASTSNAQAEMMETIKKQSKQPPAKPAPSVADELLKLKNLLDEGHITPDDYEAAKKKLLG